MAEYIKRADLIKNLNKFAPEHYTALVNQLITKQPTADVVEVKHGEWIWDKRFSDYTCSLCGNWDLKTPNYCSNCGAKMDVSKMEITTDGGKAE